MLSRYSPAFVASGRRTRCAVFAERSIVHLPSGVRRSSERSYKDLNWQRVIDHIAAEIWIVTVRLGTLVCSPRARQQRIAARHSRAGPVLGFHIHHRVLLSDLSERILVSRERAAATIDPHGLTAFAWAMVRHAGRTPRRSRDLAAHDLVCPRQSAGFLRSRLSRS